MEVEEDRTALSKFLFPDKEELPDDVEMGIWDHLDEVRPERRASARTWLGERGAR
jgi:hypothetical protein